MLLIDATGYGDNDRFNRINEGVEMLLQGIDTSAVINYNVGAGVVTHLVEEMDNRHLKSMVMRIAVMSDAEAFDLAQSAFADPDILIVDEAEHLDTMPEIAKVLQGFEEGGIKIIYMTLKPVESVHIPDDQFIIASGNISKTEIETPTPLKDRFVHMEIKVKGPKPGQSFREYLQEQSKLFHG